VGISKWDDRKTHKFYSTEQWKTHRDASERLLLSQFVLLVEISNLEVQHSEFPATSDEAGSSEWEDRTIRADRGQRKSKNSYGLSREARRRC
jgi:hypothetical protein